MYEHDVEDSEILRAEYRRPRDVLLSLVGEFICKATARLQERNKKNNQEGKIIDLLDISSHVVRVFIIPMDFLLVMALFTAFGRHSAHFIKSITVRSRNNGLSRIAALHELHFTINRMGERCHATRSSYNFAQTR